MRSLSGLILIAALALVAGCSSKPSNPPAPAAPDVAKAADAPAAPDVAKTADANPAPDVTDALNIPGGGCVYKEFPGTCELTSLGDIPRMTFKGTIDGVAVQLVGNAIREPESYFKPRAIGTTIACSIKFETEGGCTPCEFSIGGECGEDAKNAFGARTK